MRQIVITGGSGGLGSAIAEEFRSADFCVAALSSAELDVTDRIAVADWFAEKSIDLLVCCAGKTEDALLARLSPETWQRTWDVNFAGAVNCARAAMPGMVRKKSGHIVLVSSFSALHPPAGQAAYATAKAALLDWMAAQASHCGDHQIRINVISPGFLETEMTSSVSMARRREVLAEHVLGRYNTPQAAAAFIRFLHLQMPHTSAQVFALDSRPARH